MESKGDKKRNKKLHWRLENEMLGIGVSGDVGGEADGGRSLPTGVLTPGDQIVDVLEKLALARPRVPAEKDIDFWPKFTPPRLREVFDRPAE